MKTEMRFGGFASSSRRTNLKGFGNTSCFEIKTCYGAYIKKYSVLKHKEEVLIPPYETFKIMEKIEGRDNILTCDVLYKLTSTETKTNLNCKVASQQSKLWRGKL